jgi:phenylpropionate dioxygenase-like ring-hydroxylating dioxygenase large terminal subunit
MPNEPAESDFRTRVTVKAYPCQESGGVRWAYLGPREGALPALPELEWTRVPETHRIATRRIQFCNYLQNVEGEVDSSHVSFLHSRNAADSAGIRSDDARKNLPNYMARDRAPRFFVLPTDYGILIGAQSDAESDSYYWRITQFLMPTRPSRFLRERLVGGLHRRWIPRPREPHRHPRGTVLNPLA